MADRIFQRAHSVERPGPNDPLPILLEDNPSREFFFPISADEALAALKSLPKRDYAGITHLWLRRVKKDDFVEGERPLATFICGSGVRMITLYAWPKDMKLRFGQKKPSNRWQNEIKRYGGSIQKIGREWVGEFTLPALRRFCIQSILFHEVGHHVDQYCRHWSQANYKEVEEFADQYALAMTANATRVFNRLAQAASTSSTYSG